MPASDLKKAGLKVTLPRLKVLEVLEQAEPRHLSAEDVYKQLISSDDTVGLATVYRVLTRNFLKISNIDPSTKCAGSATCR